MAPLEGPDSAPGAFCPMWEQVWHKWGWERPCLLPQGSSRCLRRMFWLDTVGTVTRRLKHISPVQAQWTHSIFPQL